MQAQYDQYVLECRAIKDRYDVCAPDPMWDETGRRLENEVAAYCNKLQEVIAYHRPIASNFPTAAEFKVFEKKNAAATKALEAKQSELSAHQADDALRTADINREKLHLASLAHKEKELRTELNRLKGVQESTTDGS